MNTNTNPKLENLTAHAHVELNSSHLTKEDYFFLLDVTKKRWNDRCRSNHHLCG